MLFDVLSIRCARTHYVVVLDEAANFVASCWKVPLHQGDGWSHPAKSSWNKERWWFGNISWKVSKVVLVGWTQQIDHYALPKNIRCQVILEKHNVMFVCSVFRLQFLLHMIVFLDFYSEKRATILFPVWGLARWVVFAEWSWYWTVYTYREC